MKDPASTAPNWRFRRLHDDDLPLLHDWLNEPGVVRFWEGEDVSWPAVIADNGSPELRATLVTDFPEYDYDAEESDVEWRNIEKYVGLLDGESAGWIQCYSINAYEDHDEVKAWRALGYDPTGAGIDYLLGDPQARGMGIGSSMIRAFVDSVVFAQHPDWTQVGASPQRANAASCGALAKAGFSLLGSFDDPLGPCDLYARRRTD